MLTSQSQTAATLAAHLEVWELHVSERIVLNRESLCSTTRPEWMADITLQEFAITLAA